MRLTLRQMHESETPLVRGTWTRSIDANEERDSKGRPVSVNGRTRTIGSSANRCPWMRVGADGDLMVTWAWAAMHRAWVKDIWQSLTVIVAAHPANDEALGWVAATPPAEHPLVVHYVYTIDLERARRRGVGSTLLRAAMSLADNRPVRFSHMTHVGRHMLDSLTAASSTIRGEAAMS